MFVVFLFVTHNVIRVVIFITLPVSCSRSFSCCSLYIAFLNLPLNVVYTPIDTMVQRRPATTQCITLLIALLHIGTSYRPEIFEELRAVRWRVNKMSHKRNINRSLIQKESRC